MFNAELALEKNSQGKTSSELRTSPLLSNFPEWVAPSEDQLKNALRTGMVAVDANVILNLYKYTPVGTQDWFTAFDALGSRLWFPHQVIQEFWRNRAELVAHPKHIKAAISDMEKGFHSVNVAYKDWLRHRGEDVEERADKELATLNELKGELLARLEKSKIEHEDRFDLQPEKDEIISRLGMLISTLGEHARIGEGYSKETSQEKYKEGDRRYEEKIPPGYLDDAKNEDAKAGKKGDSKYGDWIAWSQLLDEAERFRRTHGDENRKPYVIFVTGDLKDDWWEMLPQGDGKPKARITHPKLAREMLTAADCHYIQLTPRDFLANLLEAIKGLKIDQSTLKKAEELGREGEELGKEGEWYPEIFYIKVWDKVRATARIASDGRCLILKGSKARSNLAASLPDGYRDRAYQLREGGVLVQQDENLDEYEFTADYEFPSVSQGASIVQGASASGNERWMTQEGLTLPEVRSKHRSDDD